MASSFAQAFAEIEGPALDRAAGYTITRPEPTPVDDAVRAAFLDFDWGQVDAFAWHLARRYNCQHADAEEAIYAAAERLFRRRRGLFRRPRRLMPILFQDARYRVLDLKMKNAGKDSIDALVERAGDSIFDGAQPCVSPSSRAVVEGYQPPPIPGEAWTEAQIICALQRFRDYYGRPPKVTECLSRHQLPSPSTIYRHFGTFTEAILAAGMVPDSIGQRRKRWTAVEAAKACGAFKDRNGYWPGWVDCKRQGSGLPSASVMVKFFGSTRPALVQIGVEMILGDS